LGPSDLNLTAQICLELDLISRAQHRLDGSGEKGGPGRRLLAGDHSRGGNSPEMADLGLPGPISDGIRPGRMLATRVIHLGSWRRSTGVATAHATARAARVDRARWRARGPVPTVAYDPRQLALKVRGKVVVLTKVRNSLERGGVMTSTAGRRWRRSGLVGGASAEGLRAPDHRKPTRGGPAKACRGVSLAHSLPAVSNCPRRRRAAYLNPSGGRGSCRGGGDWGSRASEC
jgi:hypothetical protein